MVYRNPPFGTLNSNGLFQFHGSPIALSALQMKKKFLSNEKFRETLLFENSDQEKFSEFKMNDLNSFEHVNST